jgi:hypothetical protein
MHTIRCCTKLTFCGGIIVVWVVEFPLLLFEKNKGYLIQFRKSKIHPRSKPIPVGSLRDRTGCFQYSRSDSHFKVDSYAAKRIPACPDTGIVATTVLVTRDCDQNSFFQSNSKAQITMVPKTTTITWR